MFFVFLQDRERREKYDMFVKIRQKKVKVQ